MTTRAPALFVGHGSPMNAIENTPSARGWAEIAQRFAKPKAVVVISAHWVTEGVRVTSNAHPRTIHDFGRSFPQALFDVQYPAPGDPDLARIIVEHRLQTFGAQLDDTWGLDHGAWSVLKRMYPDADVPVIQLSLDATLSTSDHFGIARFLSFTRNENVLLLATGNVVHNLPAFFRTAEVQPWVQNFDEFITIAALNNDDAAVLRYKAHPDANDAAPDWEHFVPVIYALGARQPGETPHIFNRSYEPGISMTSFAYGLPQ